MRSTRAHSPLLARVSADEMTAYLKNPSIENFIAMSRERSAASLPAGAVIYEVPCTGVTANARMTSCSQFVISSGGRTNTPPSYIRRVVVR
jgi:hypothetical protein